MIENSAESKAGEIEKRLLNGDVHGAEEQFRADYIEAVNSNQLDHIEKEKRVLQQDEPGYMLLMLEVSKDFVKPNSSNQIRLENVELRGQARTASAEERLRGDAAEALLDNYSELTGGARHKLRKLFTGHWGNGVVKYDVERVEKELNQEIGVRVTSDKLAANNNELFQKLSADGKNITPIDAGNALRKDDRLHFLTAQQRETVEKLYASADKHPDSRRTNYYDMPKAWSNISLSEVRRHARPDDYRYLNLTADARGSNSPASEQHVSPRERLADCDPTNEPNHNQRIRPREDGSKCVPLEPTIINQRNQQNTPKCGEGLPEIVDRSRQEEMAHLAVARYHEGYSYVATRLLGFTTPSASKVEIERAFRSLSDADKQKVMTLSNALEKAHHSVRRGILQPGDAIPISGAEVQALLRK